jgi:adenosine/AMP kinase
VVIKQTKARLRKFVIALVITQRSRRWQAPGLVEHARFLSASWLQAATVADLTEVRVRSKDAIAMEAKLTLVQIEKPEPVNFIFGQTHFIKSVEDIHEALITAVPGIKFGLAFCEASGKCLVRWTGTDKTMLELARKNALAIGAGHSFILFLAEGFYPVNVLNAVKMVPEVCGIFCATANPTQVLIAETDQGRGVVGVVDGFGPKGVEGEADIEWRKGFLRQIGYKL